MNLGVVTYILPSSDNWRKQTIGDLGYNPYENIEATYMHLDINAMDGTWGHSNIREWGIRIGSILVVRKNKANMSVHQAETFAEYCHEVIGPKVFEHVELEKRLAVAGTQMSRHQKRMGRHRVLRQYVAKAPFEKFFNEYKSGKLLEGHRDWQDAISPYKEQPQA